MKYLDEYRDADATRRCAEAIGRLVTRPWKLMEVCGGQTHAIVRFGLDEMLPSEITLIHGPGCPVCVTPIEMIDKAIVIASRAEVTFCSYGDMLRVPGSTADLLTVKSRGGDVRIVYSPLDAVKLARERPDRQVVFFAIGFETTAPANVMSVVQAERWKLDNFSVLVSHVLVPPAIRAVLDSPRNVVQGFLAAGHVCAVMGTSEYLPIAQQYRTPIVVTGFEPLDILQGIYMCVRQLEEGRAELENEYARIVRPEGNPAAIAQIQEVFHTVSRKWRGIGEIPCSGWALRPNTLGSMPINALRFRPSPRMSRASAWPARCCKDTRQPYECPVFGTRCTPDNPLGAPMVSAEGACAAYYRYRRRPAG